MNYRLVFMLSLLCAYSTIVSAEIYKWVDENGRTHYGDRPAGDGDKLNIKNEPDKSSAAPSSTQDRLRKQQRFLRAREIERSQKKQADAKARQREAQRKRNCGRARDELTRLSRASGVYTTDESGQRSYLSREARAAAEAQLKQKIKKFCS